MNASNPINLILLGRSGSGKGTQAHLLANEFGLEYMGTGDLFRELIKQDHPLARRLRETLSQGNLAPSWMAFFVWMEKLAYLEPHKGTIFDGSPRKLWEAQTLDEALAWFGRANVKVILIDVPRAVVEKRLHSRRVCSVCGKGVYVAEGEETKSHCQQCGGELVRRLEDHPEAIKKRLDWFDEEVMQSIDYFRKKGELIIVDGTKKPLEVYEEILKKLK